MVNKHYLLKQGRPRRSDRELPPPPLPRKTIFIKKIALWGAILLYFLLLGAFFNVGASFSLWSFFLDGDFSSLFVFFFYFFLPMGALSSMWESFCYFFLLMGRHFSPFFSMWGSFLSLWGGGINFGLVLPTSPTKISAGTDVLKLLKSRKISIIVIV